VSLLSLLVLIITPVAAAVLIVAAVWWEQVESVLNDFVRLREESSYHDSGMTVEAGAGMAELLADDEENYQLGATGAGIILSSRSSAAAVLVIGLSAPLH
jgi:hypothetical protein